MNFDLNIEVNQSHLLPLARTRVLNCLVGALGHDSHMFAQPKPV